MRTSRILTFTAVIAASMALTACSGSSDAGGTASPAASAAASAPAPSPVATAGLTCTDFDQAVGRVTSRMQVLTLSNGTANDQTGTFGELDAATGVLSALAPQCAADATAELAATVDAIAALEAGYQAGTDASAKAANLVLITAVADTGTAAWQKLGVDTTGWEGVRARMQ